MAKIELLIFDMDGLMVDTGRMAYQDRRITVLSRSVHTRM